MRSNDDRGNHPARRAASDSRDEIAGISSLARIRNFAMADSNSKIAWHRVQLKKNRATLKRIEIARFTVGQDKVGETQKTIDELACKIAESEKCISAYEQQTRRPLGTDFRSLTNVSWGDWNAHTNQR